MINKTSSRSALNKQLVATTAPQALQREAP
jgi:hypothetical protein